MNLNILAILLQKVNTIAIQNVFFFFLKIDLTDCGI